MTTAIGYIMVLRDLAEAGRIETAAVLTNEAGFGIASRYFGDAVLSLFNNTLRACGVAIGDADSEANSYLADGLVEHMRAIYADAASKEAVQTAEEATVSKKIREIAASEPTLETAIAQIHELQTRLAIAESMLAEIKAERTPGEPPRPCGSNDSP